MVQTGPRRLELQEFERPKVLPDTAILRIEACGICGTDIEQYHGNSEIGEYPFIPGHEPLGIIDEIGAAAAKRWGVSVGDRVAVEPLIACGACSACLSGERTACMSEMNYGFTSTAVSPSVWGAYADYMHLDQRTVLHRVSSSLPASLAVMYNPIGAGVRWAYRTPAMKMGDTVVVLGAGQRGLACVIAARAAGAGTVIVSDVARSSNRLEMALELGADAVIVADEEDSVERVRELTMGRLADIVVDVAAMAPRTLTDAIEMVRHGGTVVIGGLKGGQEIPGFVSDKLVFRSIRLQGVFTVDTASYREAIRLIEADPALFAKLHSESFALADAEHAIKRLSGEDGAPAALHVAIEPQHDPKAVVAT